MQNVVEYIKQKNNRR